MELRLSKGVGHDQRERRYDVVVQSNLMLPQSLVSTAPTSSAAKVALLRPEIEILGNRTRVLVEQLAALDVNWLGNRVAQLGRDTMWVIDDALGIVLDLR